MPISVLAERRAALLGFVYSPFRIRDLMRRIVGHGIPDIDLAIVDGANQNPEHLLYSTQDASVEVATKLQPRYSATKEIVLPGRVWTICFQSRPRLEQELDSHQSVLFAVLGTTIFVLLSFIVWSLAGSSWEAPSGIAKNGDSPRLLEYPWCLDLALAWRRPHSHSFTASLRRAGSNRDVRCGPIRLPVLRQRRQ